MIFQQIQDTLLSYMNIYNNKMNIYNMNEHVIWIFITIKCTFILLLVIIS